MDASQLSTGVFHVEHIGNMAECSTWNVCEDRRECSTWNILAKIPAKCSTWNTCLVFAQVVGCYPMRCDLDAKSPTYVGVGPVMQFLTDRKRLSVLLPSHLLLFGDRLLTQLTHCRLMVSGADGETTL
jgi:hypothetical protein